jgi:hypothetical protein
MVDIMIDLMAAGTSAGMVVPITVHTTVIKLSTEQTCKVSVDVIAGD